MIGFPTKRMRWNKVKPETAVIRCGWVTDDPIYIKYHDEEWGNIRRFHDDHYLFEMLTLEGAQAGLSWITILKRREAYREAFCHFDAEKVAIYTEKQVEALMNNEGIIRNKRKIISTIHNAQAFIDVQKEFGSFHQFLWDFFHQRQIVNHWKTDEEVPAFTTESVRLSKALKKRGFSFVGPVICYSFMQAVGIVDDHTTECYLYNESSEIK